MEALKCLYDRGMISPGGILDREERRSGKTKAEGGER